MEVDAKYIKDMLNEPNLQPNAAINRWIQGILMFDFTIIHIPATRHVGPDALSRRSLGEGEIVKEEDDACLDDIVLLTWIISDEELLTPHIFTAFSLPLEAPNNLNPQDHNL